MSIVFALEPTNQLSLLPDKDLVDLCPPIEPYQVTKNQKYLPALIPTLTGIIVGYLMCPPQVAEILSAIVAVYIIDQGLDKFCQNCSDS